MASTHPGTPRHAFRKSGLLADLGCRVDTGIPSEPDVRGRRSSEVPLRNLPGRATSAAPFFVRVHASSPRLPEERCGGPQRPSLDRVLRSGPGSAHIGPRECVSMFRPKTLAQKVGKRCGPRSDGSAPDGGSAGSPEGGPNFGAKVLRSFVSKRARSARTQPNIGALGVDACEDVRFESFGSEECATAMCEARFTR